MKYVIIGNSASGTSAIEGIREQDPGGQITIISEEEHPNYSRPLISYLLGKKILPEEISFRDEDFYRENAVQLMLGVRARQLDIENSQVVLSTGRKLPFDKLLIATGGIPIVPEVAGRDLDGVYTFLTLSDSRRIAAHIEANGVKEAVVIGGGLIGLKAAEALIELDIRVTIVELADRILSTTFDHEASHIIQEALAGIGCRVITGCTIDEIKGTAGRVTSAVTRSGEKLAAGEELAAGLIVTAIGVRPNIQLAGETPLLTRRGILVDPRMRTNVDGIYAAGDCCEADTLLGKGQQTIAIWPIAVKQGVIAGCNMAGGSREYPGGLAMNSVELCGIATISVGLAAVDEGEGYEVIRYRDEKSDVYKKVVLRDNKIVGAVFVGDIRRAGIYTGLIKDGVDTSPFREHLLRDDFGLLNLPSEYRTHLVTREGIEV